MNITREKLKDALSLTYSDRTHIEYVVNKLIAEKIENLIKSLDMVMEKHGKKNLGKPK